MESRTCVSCGSDITESTGRCVVCGAESDPEHRARDAGTEADSHDWDSTQIHTTAEDEAPIARGVPAAATVRVVRSSRVEPEPAIPPAEPATPPVPARVSRNGSRLAAIPMILALAGMLIIQKYVVTTFAAGSMLHRLFVANDGLVLTLVPNAILFVFLWSMFDLLMRCGRALRDRGTLRHKILSRLESSAESNGRFFKEMNQAVSGLKKGRVSRRLGALMIHLRASGNVQRSHEFFRHQSEIDTDRALSGYTMVRVFIWAMPILGFIGTVIGIGLAVGDFSGFLTGDIENLDLVKNELSQVAGGLSFAFDTTLLGLVASLAAMLAMSVVQKIEQGFLTELEGLGLDVIASYGAAKGSRAQDAGPEESSGIVRRLRTLMDSHSRDLTIALRDFIEGFSESSNRLVTTLSGMRPGLVESHRAIESTIAATANDIAAATNGFSARVAEVGASIDANDRAIRQTLKTIEDLSSRLSNAVTDSAEGFRHSSDALTERVDSLAPAQEVLGRSMETLENFKQLLTEMQGAQGRIAPVLEQLSRPLELRLVPAAGTANPQPVGMDR